MIPDINAIQDSEEEDEYVTAKSYYIRGTGIPPPPRLYADGEIVDSQTDRITLSMYLYKIDEKESVLLLTETGRLTQPVQDNPSKLSASPEELLHKEKLSFNNS